MKLASILVVGVLAGGVAATPAFAEMGACTNAHLKPDLEDQVRLYSICLDGLWESARAGAHNNRGVANLLMGNDLEAERDFDMSLFYDGEYGLAYINRARVLARREQISSAIADLTAATELDPARVRVDANFQRGLLREKSGDYARALEDYDAVIDRWMPAPLFAFLDHELDRKKEQITGGMLAKSLLRSTAEDPAFRDGAEAMSLAQEALSREESAAAHAVLAAAYAENGQFDLAVRHQNQALQMAGDVLGPSVETLQAGLETYQAGEAYRSAAANCELAVAGVGCRGEGWRVERMQLRKNSISVSSYVSAGSEE